VQVAIELYQACEHGEGNKPVIAVISNRLERMNFVRKPANSGIPASNAGGGSQPGGDTLVEGLYKQS